ncbi:MAG: response regulator [Nitrospirota bacterium]|nr:response regulator [Nitrospirota bacterium]
MTTPRPGASGHTWRRTRQVLLVDDDPNDRGRLKALFTDWQWDVLEASSGREALDILDRHAIDVVLLDVPPQGADGAEIVDAIRQRIRDLPVVIMGALMTPEFRRVWRSRGAMECLSKPVEPRTLSALLFACISPSGFADS